MFGMSLEMIMKCVCIFAKGQFTLSRYLFIDKEKKKGKLIVS